MKLFKSDTFLNNESIVFICNEDSIHSIRKAMEDQMELAAHDKTHQFYELYWEIEYHEGGFINVIPSGDQLVIDVSGDNGMITFQSQNFLTVERSK